MVGWRRPGECTVMTVFGRLSGLGEERIKARRQNTIKEARIAEFGTLCRGCGVGEVRFVGYPEL